MTHKDFTVAIHKSSDFHWVGDGFPVRSVFSYNDLGGGTLSPFLLLDYATPYQFAPSEARRGVGAHPHRGFETVTIVYQGELEHRDSSGGGGKIGPGDVQWMTAASGLLHDEFHSEKFSKEGGTFEVAQLWVNLPAKFKSAKPGYQTLLRQDIPTLTLPGDSGTARIIAGELSGVGGPAKTFTPINLWDLAIEPGSELTLPLPEGHSKAILVLRGEVTVHNKRAVNGDLIVLDRASSDLSLEAHAATKLLVLTGEPINEPVVGYGPFVMNSEEEIRQAYADFRSGKLGQLE